MVGEGSVGREGRGGGPSGGRFGGEGVCDGDDAHDGGHVESADVSLREQNRFRLRRVAEWVEQRGWEVVLVTELFREREGVIWMEENEHRTALVHGRKAGVLLRGTALLRWIEERQQKWIYERVMAVSVGGVRLVAVY